MYRTLLGVSIMEMTHNNSYTMKTNPVLTPSKVRYISPFKVGVSIGWGELQLLQISQKIDYTARESDIFENIQKVCCLKAHEPSDSKKENAS